MISLELLPQILEMARWIVVRLFIFMGLLSLFPTILVLLLEPVIIAMRTWNARSPASSTATSRATTPSSSRMQSRNPSRSPSLSRKRTPQPSAPSSAAPSPMLRDFTPSTKENSGRGGGSGRDHKMMLSDDKQAFAVPIPAVMINPATLSNIVDGMTVSHRKVNPGALVASLPSSPQLTSF